tara:strand:+ start:1367 stop:2002 length:636 start_codon:yes stop_codon:yes gene_type:complete
MSKELFKRILSSVILIPIALFFIIKGSFLFIFFIGTCFCIIAYEWHMMRKKKKFYFLGLLFLCFSFTTIYELRFHISSDYIVLLIITIICVATDMGGYIFGKLFKGPKLTKLSPNKTYAGMIGGFFLSLIFLSLSFQYFEMEFTINWLFFTLLVSSISQIGDIIISYFKRLSKIKDTGKIIPGHGGLLDRVDGMIFAFPFSYLIILLGILS